METSHLPALEIATRIPRLQEALADAGVDFLLVTNLTNVRYLSGFTGSAGRLLVSDAGVVLLTDGRYGEQAEAQLAGAGVAADLEVAGDAGQRAARVRIDDEPLSIEVDPGKDCGRGQRERDRTPAAARARAIQRS